MTKIGIFGGSFDPVHLGHLLVGEFCREQAQLDEVWFVPVYKAPHKSEGPVASDKHRVEMLKLATWGQSGFQVSDLEIRRGGISYTVDTLEAVKQTQPETQFFFLMGADSLNDFGTWSQPERICQLATPLVVVRGGEKEPQWTVLQNYVEGDLVEIKQRHRIDFPAIDLSSSEIRKRVEEGRSIRFQTPRSVEEYIRTQAVYSASSHISSVNPGASSP